MTGDQAILSLEGYGYRFTLQPNHKIRIEKPTYQPKAGQQILESLRSDKSAAVHLLQQRAQGATVAIMEDQTTRSTDYADIKPLKYAQDAGEVEVKRIIYHRKSGLIEAVWRPMVPLPFLNLDKYRQIILPPDGG